MKIIKKITDGIDTFTKWTGYGFACITMLTLVVIIFEVFMRRILNSPQIWTMDVIVMSFGCYVILISAFGLMSQSFVAVDVLYERWSKMTQHIMSIITYTIFFVPFVGKLVPAAYKFFIKAYTTGELGYSVWQPPTWPVKGALFLGFALLAVQGVSEILKHVYGIGQCIEEKKKGKEV